MEAALQDGDQEAAHERAFRNRHRTARIFFDQRTVRFTVPGFAAFHIQHGVQVEISPFAI